MRKFVIFFVYIFSIISLDAVSLSKLSGNMDKTFFSEKKPVFRVVYKSLDVLDYSKVMGVKVPSRIQLNNFVMWVNTYNITQSVLDMFNRKIPFSVSTKPFRLVLIGKNRRLTIKADSATLTPINTLVLRGSVKMVGKHSVSLGDKATLSLDGYSLLVSFAGEKVKIKF